MPTKAKLSSKHQIVVPKAIREMGHLKAGDTLVLDWIGSHGIILKKPKSWTESLQGLGKDIWKGVDAVRYVRGLRKEWSQSEKRRRPS